MRYGKSSIQAVELDRSIAAWADLLQSQLIGVAEVSSGHAEMYMDASGRCYVASVMHDAFGFAGTSFAEAAERELLGRPWSSDSWLAFTVY